MYSAFTQQNAQQLQPDNSGALGLLQHLDKQQLQDMLDDEAKFEQIIMDLPQIKSLQDDKESSIASNKSLAEYNISKRPVLAQLKSNLSVKYSSAKTLHQEFQVKSNQFNAGSDSQMTVDTALALLQSESKLAEELAEEIADQFIGGSTTADEFLNTFLRESTNAHCLKVKTEKLQTIATRLRQGLPLDNHMTAPVTTSQVPSQQPQQPMNNFYSGAGQWGGGAAMPEAGNYFR